jgi:hypothetical protein
MIKVVGGSPAGTVMTGLPACVDILES